MFSVVIPLYNKELSIKNTIQSVLNQSFQDFEIVIINDGSTDNSVEVVEAFDDPRIHIIHQKNQGVSAARNKGIEEAKYEWIAFLDADDLWKENHLKEVVMMIKLFSEEKVFCTSFVRSNEEIVEEDACIEYIENYFERSIKQSFFWTSVTCIHESVFKEVGDFKIYLNRGEDLDLWDRIARQYHFVRSTKVTAIYRIEAENRSDLNFELKKSRVYNYDFSEATSNSEKEYYKKQIVNSLKGRLVNFAFLDFIRLMYRHRNYVTILDIIKK